MTRSIRLELLTMFIGLSLIPLLFVGSIISFQSFHNEKRHAQERQREISARAATLFLNFLESTEHELRLIIQMPQFRDADREQQASVLSRALFYENIFNELTLIDHTGQEQVRVSRLGVVQASQLQNHSLNPTFLTPLQNNKPYYGTIRLSSVNNEPLLQMSAPTLDVQDAQADGVLLSEVRLRQVLDEITNIQLGDNGVISVLNAEGKIIAHRDPSVLAEQRSFDLSIEDGVTVGTTGEDVLLTKEALHISDMTLYILTELPLIEAREVVFRTIITTILLVLVTMIVSTTLGVFAVGRIVKPIQTLAAATLAVSNGDLTQLVQITRKDEIGSLQRDFNQMVSNLYNQRSMLEDRTYELQQTFDNQQHLFATITQLSSPLLPVWHGIVVLPIIGHVDTQRGQQILDTLVHGVIKQKAHIVILDITGIATVDTQVIGLLIQAMQAVKLLGVHVGLAGISSIIARMIVEQGIDLSEFIIHRDLQTAIQDAITHLEEYR